MDERTCFNCVHRDLCVKRSFAIFRMYIATERYSEVDEAKANLDVSVGCEHYERKESGSWFAQVRWCAEDVIAAAEQNGLTLTPAQAEKWLEKNERWFREMLTEYGNEVLASASRESFEEVSR